MDTRHDVNDTAHNIHLTLTELLEAPDNPDKLIILLRNSIELMTILKAMNYESGELYVEFLKRIPKIEIQDKEKNIELISPLSNSDIGRWLTEEPHATYINTTLESKFYIFDSEKKLFLNSIIHYISCSISMLKRVVYDKYDMDFIKKEDSYNEEIIKKIIEEIIVPMMLKEAGGLEKLNEYNEVPIIKLKAKLKNYYMQSDEKEQFKVETIKEIFDDTYNLLKFFDSVDNLKKNQKASGRVIQEIRRIQGAANAYYIKWATSNKLLKTDSLKKRILKSIGAIAAGIIISAAVAGMAMIAAQSAFGVAIFGMVLASVKALELTTLAGIGALLLVSGLFGHYYLRTKGILNSDAGQAVKKIAASVIK